MSLRVCVCGGGVKGVVNVINIYNLAAPRPPPPPPPPPFSGTTPWFVMSTVGVFVLKGFGTHCTPFIRKNKVNCLCSELTNVVVVSGWLRAYFS